jgi:hypothetical protein
MKFRIEFDTDNAAFADHFWWEVADVLDQIADSRREEGLLRDSNGNRIGFWSHEEV